MSQFFKTSTTWVVDFRYDGHPRRWFKSLRPGQDAGALMAEELRELHGERAKLVEVRPATAAEESEYLRGAEPRNALCPTGRQPRTVPGFEPDTISSSAAYSPKPQARGPARSPPPKPDDREA